MVDNIPFLSVIIPVYNAERHIGDAVRSILCECYISLEIIAVDDGSTDNSAEILKSFSEVTYYKQANSGPAAARNLGVRMSKGDFILFLDADDLFPAGKIRQQLSYFEQRPEIEIVMGKSQFFFEDGSSKTVFRFPDETYQVLNVLLGSGLYRRSVFDKVGLFEESLQFSEDFDWFNRVRELGIPILVTDDIALYYRRHDTNMTHSMDLVKLKTIQMLKRSLDRRREEGEVRELPKLSEFKS